MILFFLASLGIFANTVLILTIVFKTRLRRWNQGLVLHQALVDCLRSTLLIPMGISIMGCQPINKCSLLETSFLVLVTASTINLLTTVLNDTPVLPDDTEEDAIPILMDSPQCVLFGIFIIWFASITINLGPTFLSGTMAANSNFRPREPSCPLVQGPYRHYILNFLWIWVNLLCVILTLYHLFKLNRDFSKRNEDSIRIASLVTSIIATDDLNVEGEAKNSIVVNLCEEGYKSEKMAVSTVSDENSTRVAYLHTKNMKSKSGENSLCLKKYGDNSLCLHYAHQNQNGGGAKAKNGFVNTAYSRQISSSTTQSGSGDGRGGEGGLFDSPKPRIVYADPNAVKNYLNVLERDGIERVKMFFIIASAYLIFWGPLFLVTLVNWDWEFEQAKQSMAHEVTLHVAFVHSFVNPALYMALHRGIRESAVEMFCLSWLRCITRFKCQNCLRGRGAGPVVISAENRTFM